MGSCQGEACLRRASLMQRRRLVEKEVGAGVLGIFGPWVWRGGGGTESGFSGDGGEFMGKRGTSTECEHLSTYPFASVCPLSHEHTF